MITFLIFFGALAFLSFVRTMGYRLKITELEKRLDDLEDEARAVARRHHVASGSSLQLSRLRTALTKIPR